MSEETKVASAPEAGSAPTGPEATGATGQPATTTQQTDSSKNYEELERKFGDQGRELGELRTFVKNIEPLLNKLDPNPELIQAILDDKIDQKLVSAILEGKVKIEEAQQVAEAQEQVKKEMGNQAFNQADPAEIEKRIFEKVSKAVEQSVEQRFKTAEEKQEFEGNVTDFISNTKDFPEYADRIAVWLNEHPDQDDIEVAYDAVKGKVLAEKAAKGEQVVTGEQAKEVAANAGGGNAPSPGTVKPEEDLWDKLVAPKSNPNYL